jgi:hypothetical protein
VKEVVMAETSTRDDTRRRIRQRRRIERMAARGVGVARPACVTCLFMALLWVLGMWVRIPIWAVALVALGGLALVGLFAVARRGRTVRW